MSTVPQRPYVVVKLEDQTFAVNVSLPSAPPRMVTGFSDEGAAFKWIDDQVTQAFNSVLPPVEGAGARTRSRR